MSYVYPHKVLKPGDKVWYIMAISGRKRWSPREYVVECTITEINTIYTHPTRDVSIWHNKHLNDEYHETATAATDVIGPEGWPIHEKIDLSLLETLPVVNQLIWIDEPVGHAINLYDECWLTLEEAMICVKYPTRKKHLKRNLKKARNSVYRFVAGTWLRSGTKHPGFKPLPMKKIYVR